MEKRALLATLVCMGIFVLWILVYPKIFRPATPPPKAAQPSVTAPAKTTPTTTPVTPPAVTPEAKGADFPEEPPITIETRHFRYEFTNKGAGIRSLTLKYPRENDALPLLRPLEPGFPHFAVRHVGGPDKIESIPWKLEERKGNELLEFSYPLRSGVEIRKAFRLDPDHYTLKVTIELKPPKAEPGKPPTENSVQLELLAFNGLVHESPYQYERYFKGVALVGGKLREDWVLGKVEKGEGKLAEAVQLPAGPDRQEKIADAWSYFWLTEPARQWFGLKNRFFTVLLLPDSHAAQNIQYYDFRVSSPDAVRNSKDPQNPNAPGLKNLNAELWTRTLKITDRPEVFNFEAYAGPIEKEALTQLPDAQELFTYGSGCIVPSGIINIIGSAILAILKFFAGLFHNWGVGIIATTLLIRICISPLSKKSQESAFKMQQLAPKIKILQERYKDDREKLSMEHLRLMREAKVNPLSGCLPLFLQLPIFVGMFSVFDSSIELRGQPFIAWIKDLSRPDRLVHLGTTVDVFFLPTFDSLNLLPIIMTITWFLQAYFAPRSPDPQMQQQQKMMMLMPIIFGLMCYNYASGLSLYFLINSLLAMIEQKVIKRYILKIGRDGKPLEPPGPPKPA